MAGKKSNNSNTPSGADVEAGTSPEAVAAASVVKPAESSESANVGTAGELAPAVAAAQSDPVPQPVPQPVAQSTAVAAEESDHKKFRFCIKPKKDEAGNELGEEEFTDNVHVAYAARDRGHKVIDHANGNREYDGTNPVADAAAKAAKK